MPSVIFSTPRLSVRSITRDDFDHFYRMHSDPEVMRYIRPVKTRGESDAFVEKALEGFEDPALGRWLVEEKEGGTVVGTFVIVPSPQHPGTINLGYLLMPAFWGKGYATELVTGALSYFFDRTACPEIYAVIESENNGSRRVLEKAGFNYHDQYPEGKKMLWRYRKCRS